MLCYAFRLNLGTILLFVSILEGASGTICNTMGCNFTLDYTFPLKLLLFPRKTPAFASTPLYYITYFLC